ncbi:MAG: nucleotidyl transferase AbiEii/AbiGii toxin family protein [Candidatus Hadarchaeales archaeon]
MEKRVPIYIKMKREAHRKIARLQDIILETLYRVFPRSVLHGGTAIWRCYSGNRFSEDLDVYLEKDAVKIERLFKELRKAGFSVVKKGTTKNSLFSTICFEGTEVRIEALFKSIGGVLREYETYEGILLNVFTLEPEKIIREKVEAYLKRRKIRDLYDVFFMLRHVKEKSKIKRDIQRLLQRFKDPVDEGELRALILFGPIPTKEDILRYLGGFV